MVGIFGYMTLRKGGSGCCGGHSHNSHADTTHDHHVHEDRVDSKVSKTAVDPVCGMKVDTTSALSATKYGKTYYFCSKGCKKEFIES